MCNFKSHKNFMPDKVNSSYLFPHACFSCRKSFRRPVSEEPRKCPDCGGQAVRLSRKFKAPKKDDVNAWLVVKFVVDSGLVYQSIHLEGGYLAEYPKTMKEAEVFVAQYGRHKS